MQVQTESGKTEKLLLKKKEVAFLLSVSLQGIENMIAQGVLPAVKLGPRSIRVPAAAVEALITHGLI